MTITAESLTKNCGSEHCHQTALFCHAALHFEQYPQLRLMFAIPNGGERNLKVAAGLKAEGVKAGVPDICLPVARGKFHGLFIEMKITPNKLSAEQIHYLLALGAEGYYTTTCWSWLEAWNCIEFYLNLR